MEMTAMANSGRIGKLSVLAGLAMLAIPIGAARAATFGSDNATNYGGAWNNGDNHGAGFGAWNLGTYGSGGFAGFYVGSNGSTGNVTTGGVELGMYGTGGTGGDAYRSFDAPLLVGQTFSLDLGVNYRNGYKGVDINTASGQAFNFNVGGDDYVVSNAASGNGSVGNAYSSDAAFHLSFTQTSATGGTWEIDRTGGVTSTTLGTFTGVLTQFHLYIGATGGNGSPDDLNANNFAITPEPGSAAIFMIGTGLFGLKRRRR